MSDVMKRWEAHRPGIDALRVEEVVRPEPAPGEVLVRVTAVSLNFRDLAMLEGSLGKWSGVQSPGSEMAGEVVAVGTGVTRFAIGDKVISVDIRHWIDGPAPEADTNTAPFLGRLAEYSTVPEDLLVRAPASLDAAAASTLSVAGLTAWFALVELAKVRAGETVVVQGTGGVALFAVQFAAAHGASVIVVSGSKRKLERVKALGATHGIDRSEIEDWDSHVLKLTGGRGADHVLEMGGGDITRSLNAIRVGGRISIIGLLNGSELRASITTIMFKRAQLVGLGVGHRRALQDMIAAIDHLKLQPVIDAVYSFDQVPEAFAHVKRGAFGKVVVRIER
ncbi:zinc-dependent alcohol dehydrogenase family protein [Paraburkholderia terrae]|uniref:zinc-dependent alcohol dehydrogenase family protein n=1 Tax=Paraburkholderia terrae TaxID=311230 RepID=UPI00296B52DA|nr:NAD(P)-dependent alcohol dehydrogenase [Paraburkholderia terrae]MDW3660420.1 NAD(P)-dependent alcohol dehydrogenase [Paraburkholderia terrae]